MLSVRHFVYQLPATLTRNFVAVFACAFRDAPLILPVRRAQAARLGRATIHARPRAAGAQKAARRYRELSRQATPEIGALLRKTHDERSTEQRRGSSPLCDPG